MNRNIAPMKMWVFGQSMATAYGLEETQGWPYLLSQALNAEYVNFARTSVDNLFIYHTFLENYKQINKDDIVIIGWSHPTRKTFVFDKNNSAHVEVLLNSLQYTTATETFFRSSNQRPDTKSKWSLLKPKDTGLAFFDTWFNNYFSEHEQRCNFQSYLDSVELKVLCRYIPFYFSQESTTSLSIDCHDNFMLEFVIAHSVAISEQDYHPNAQGHILWCQHLLKQIKNENSILTNTIDIVHDSVYNRQN